MPSDEEIENMNYRDRIDQAKCMYEKASAFLNDGYGDECQKQLEEALRYLFDVDTDSPKSAQNLKRDLSDLMQQVCFSIYGSNSTLVVQLNLIPYICWFQALLLVHRSRCDDNEDTTSIVHTNHASIVFDLKRGLSMSHAECEQPCLDLLSLFQAAEEKAQNSSSAKQLLDAGALLPLLESACRSDRATLLPSLTVLAALASHEDHAVLMFCRSTDNESDQLHPLVVRLIERLGALIRLPDHSSAAGPAPIESASEAPQSPTATGRACAALRLVPRGETCLV